MGRRMNGPSNLAPAPDRRARFPFSVSNQFPYPFCASPSASAAAGDARRLDTLKQFASYSTSSVTLSQWPFSVLASSLFLGSLGCSSEP